MRIAVVLCVSCLVGISGAIRKSLTEVEEAVNHVQKVEEAVNQEQEVVHEDQLTRKQALESAKLSVNSINYSTDFGPHGWAGKLVRGSERAVGSGSFGKVYVARLVCNNMKVAIKVMKAQKKLVDQEVALLKGFSDSPRFTAFFNAGKDNVQWFDRQTNTYMGQFYIMMEAANGGDLNNVVVSTASTPTRTRLWYEMMEGIKQMHDKGVVHRDLKPGNVMLSEKCEEHMCKAKVGDLGLACSMVNPSQVPGVPVCVRGEFSGTPMYMAPEIFTVPRQVDLKNDVWACGIMFYQLLFGKIPVALEAVPPNAINDVNAIGPAVRNLDIRRDRRFLRLAPDVQSFLFHMLDPNLHSRYSASQALAKAQELGLNEGSTTDEAAVLPCWEQGGAVAPDHHQPRAVNIWAKDPISKLYTTDFLTIQNALSSQLLMKIFDTNYMDVRTGIVIGGTGDASWPSHWKVGTVIENLNNQPYREVHRILSRGEAWEKPAWQNSLLYMYNNQVTLKVKIPVDDIQPGDYYDAAGHARRIGVHLGEAISPDCLSYCTRSENCINYPVICQNCPLCLGYM